MNKHKEIHPQCPCLASGSELRISEPADARALFPSLVLFFDSFRQNQVSNDYLCFIFAARTKPKCGNDAQKQEQNIE